MTEDTLVSGLDFFIKLAQRDPKKFHEKKTIIFYGGEPFLYKKTLFFAIDTIRTYVKKGKLPKDTQIIVVSNGVLLKPDDINFLKENNVTLTLSIDGNKKANANRVFPGGQEAFQKIVNTHKLCRQANLNINIACTITPETIEQSKASVDFFYP